MKERQISIAIQYLLLIAFCIVIGLLPCQHHIIIVVLIRLSVLSIFVASLLPLCFAVFVLLVLPIFSDSVKRWVHSNAWFYYLAYATFFVTYIVLACCSGVRRKFPGNYIALFVFVSTQYNNNTNNTVLQHSVLTMQYPNNTFHYKSIIYYHFVCHLLSIILP